MYFLKIILLSLFIRNFKIVHVVELLQKIIINIVFSNSDAFKHVSFYLNNIKSMSENKKQYGLTTAEDIRDFLDFWPQFQYEFLETWQSAPEDLQDYLTNNYSVSSWCHLYDLPVREHNRPF